MSARLVVVDGDVLGRGRTGDETYVENLLRALAGLNLPIRLAAVVRDGSRVPNGIEALELPAHSQVRRMAFRLPHLLRSVRPSLVHFLYVIPPGFRSRAIVTVHDLSFERHPEFMSPRDRLVFRALVPRSVRRAARVLVGSEWTKRDVVDRYRARAETVVVTPYGVDPLFRPDGPRSAGPPYALFVGAIQPRKDPICAVEALARIDPRIRLVFAGPEKRGADEVKRAVARLGLARQVTFAGHVPKERLAELYRGAACLVFPSRYEGFGLPVLEAMASGTPVVAARATAIPEVAGDAAILVEPGDPAALARGVEQALAGRSRLAAAGLERAGLFSWTETARRTAEVYLELV